MRTLTFVRHGESISNAGGITMAHDAIPLSSYGHHQANKLAALLKIEPAMVLVSRFVRTQQTAAPFCSMHGANPKAHPALHEFSVIDPDLIAGLDGAQRKPFVHSYWDDPNPHRRIGENADTFAEFQDRVNTFMGDMADFPDSTVVFGHGIWFGLLFWRLLGYSVTDADSMRVFRRFQLGFPMPNCAVFNVAHMGSKHWSIQARSNIAQQIAALL